VQDGHGYVAAAAETPPIAAEVWNELLVEACGTVIAGLEVADLFVSKFCVRWENIGLYCKPLQPAIVYSNRH